MQISVKTLEEKVHGQDKELLEAIKALQSGEQSAFEVIYRHTYKFMFYKAEQLLRSQKQADSEVRNDLVQDAYIKIYQNISSLQDPARFYGWMNMILTNTVLAYGRSHWREVMDVVDEEGESMVENWSVEERTPEDEVLDQERLKYISEALESLPLVQRCTVEYYYFLDMSVEEIAKAMECSEGTVKSRLNYARKKLKGVIEEIEQTKNIKLHGLFVLPFMLLWSRQEAFAMELNEQMVGKVYDNICQSAQIPTGTVYGGENRMNQNTNNNVNNTTNGNVNSVAEGNVEKVFSVEEALERTVDKAAARRAEKEAAETVAVDSVSTSIWTTAAGKVMVAITVALVGLGIFFGGVFEIVKEIPVLNPGQNNFVVEEQENPVEEYNPVVDDEEIVGRVEDVMDPEEIPGTVTEESQTSEEIVTQPVEGVTESVEEPVVETAEVPVEQGPQIVKLTDPTLMEKEEMGVLQLSYTQEHARSNSVGITPGYGHYEYILRYFRNEGSWANYDEAYFGSHPEFEMDGAVTPIFVFEDEEDNDSDATDLFVTASAQVNVTNEKTGKWESWGKLADLPEEFSTVFREIIDYTWDEYTYSEADVIGFARNHTPEFVDDKGRTVYGFEGSKVYVIQNDRAVDTGLTWDHSLVSYVLTEKDFEESPFEYEIYVTIGEGEDVEYYLIVLGMVYVGQTVEINYISEVDCRFADAMDPYWFYNSSVEIAAMIYELKDEVVVE